MPSKPVHSAYIELRADDKKLAADIAAAVAAAEKKVRKIRVGVSPSGSGSGGTSGISGTTRDDNFYRGFSGLATLYATQRLLGQAIKVGSDFETGMAKIATLLNKSERGSLPSLARNIRNIGSRYGQSYSVLQEAAYESLSAQIPVGKLPRFLEVATKSGMAGGSDTKTAIDALTTVINSYGFAVEDAERISDTLFKTVDRGKITYEQLAATIGKVASQAALAGISFDELTGTIATLTRAGIKPSEAMTSIYGLIAGFLNPTETSQKAASKYGLDLNANTLSKLGFSGVAWALKDATPEDLLTIANQRKGFRAIATLNNNRQGNITDVGIMSGAMSGVTGATNDAFSQFEKTFAIRMQRLANDVASYFIDAFDIYKGYLATFAEEAGRVLLGKNNNSKSSRFIDTPFNRAGEESGVSTLLEPLFYAYESMYAGSAPNLRPGEGASRDEWQKYFARTRKNNVGKLKADLARKDSISKYGEIPTYDTAALAQQEEARRLKSSTASAQFLGFIRNVDQTVAKAQVKAKAMYNFVLEKGRESANVNSTNLSISQIGIGDLDFNKQLNFLSRKTASEKEILRYKLASEQITQQEYKAEMTLIDAKNDASKKEIIDSKRLHDLDTKSLANEIDGLAKITKLKMDGKSVEAEVLEIQEDSRKKKEQLQRHLIQLKSSGADAASISSVENSIKNLSSIEAMEIKMARRNGAIMPLNPYSNPTMVDGMMRTIYPSTSVSSTDVDQEILAQIRAMNDNFRRGVGIKESGGILRITF